MTNTAGIQVGPVSGRRNAALHTITGAHLAACHPGWKALTGTRDLTPETARTGRLCHRAGCRTAVLDAIADAQADAVHATGRNYREATVRRLADLSLALETPAEASHYTQMAACIAAQLADSAPADPNQDGWDRLDVLLARSTALAPAVQALPEAPRRRTWAALRDEYDEAYVDGCRQRIDHAQQQLALTP